MSNYIIDTSTKQLTFLDARFYRTMSGGFVPSVTTILEAFPKDAAFFAWLKSQGENADAVRDDAGRRGTTVHKLTEAYDAGLEVSLLTESGEIGYRMSEWAMFERYVEFTQRCHPRIILSEQNYIHDGLGYAGTIDRVVEIGGVTTLMDIKTSNNLHASYWLQLAAYRTLLHRVAGIEVDQVAILWLNSKTRTEGKKGALQGIGWQLITKDNTTDDMALFLITQQLWQAQNADAKPRQATYQLTHKKPTL